MRDTQHNRTILKIQQYWRENYGVEMRVRGMRKAVWKLYRSQHKRLCAEEGEQYDESLCEYAFSGDFPKPGFNPDLYCAQAVGDIVRLTAIEVEDTSRLTETKLAKLGATWFYADCSEFIEFRCWACDRFGNGWRQIDLEEAWFKYGLTAGVDDDALAA